MHQIRVTICGLHPKLDGLAGLLPAHSRHWRVLNHAAVRPVIVDIRRECKTLHGRTHTMRTNRPYASAAFAHAASFRLRGKANAAARLAPSKPPLDGNNLDDLQAKHTMWADHIFSLTAACHGAVYCNFVINHAEATSALSIAPKGASDFPPEYTFPAGRADEFDTPPPRQEFL
jgi:hypothetical protein